MVAHPGVPGKTGKSMSRIPVASCEESVIPGRAKREPGISRFPDVQLHI